MAESNEDKEREPASEEESPEADPQEEGEPDSEGARAEVTDAPDSDGGAQGDEDEASDAEDEASDADPGSSAKAARPEGAEEPPDKERGSGMTVGLLGFLLALGFGFFIGQFVRDDGEVEIERGARFSVSLRGDEPQIGPDDALVTIIEFADYQCPYCAQSNAPLKDAAKKFDDDVRIIYKHFPLPSHNRATPSAKAAWAAHQQGKFWPIHDFLFANKASIDAALQEATRIGLDVEKFKVDMVSEEAARSVDEDLKAGSILGVRGTPAFFVNGHPYKGKRNKSQWIEIIEAELEQAEELVDGGTARANVYAKLMEGAETKGRAPREPQAATAGPDPAATYKIPVQGRSSLGADDALVTVAVFSDFQCPYCERLKPVAHDLVERNDDVRVVFVNLPLPMHSRARDAAKAALAAGRQGRFWEMHDKLFDNRSQLGSADFDAYAQELGLDVDQFRTDFASDAISEEIAADEALARRLKVSSTPSSFVNGRYVRGAQPVPMFEALIAEERTKAQALIDGGTARGEVYDRLMQDAQTEAAGG